jgi:hypothetical protein
MLSSIARGVQLGVVSPVIGHWSLAPFAGIL